MGIKFDVIFKSIGFSLSPPSRITWHFSCFYLSGSGRKETRRENSTGSILEIPHRSQPWRHFPASQPAWQPARLLVRKLASCAAGFRLQVIHFVNLFDTYTFTRTYIGHFINHFWTFQTILSIQAWKSRKKKKHFIKAKL